MMTTRAATPPAQHGTRVRTPDAPRHGPQFDNNGPLSPRRSRRSTRNPYSSSSNGATTTPPPQSSPPSPPMSPLATASRRSPTTNRHKPRDRANKLQAQRWDNSGLLLTPAKTPKTLTPPSTGVTRRINFQLADPSHAMPTPRKMKKRSAAVEEVAVYSDWNARVPTVDESADNPFNGPPTPASRPRQRRRKASPKPLKAGISNEEMRERADNDEGLIFTFRGKQVFRPYTDTLSSIEETESLGYKPIRRSTKQPRRLDFGVPSADTNDVDEEAVTDIEEEEPQANDDTSAPSSQMQPGSEKISPFSGWARTKSSRKREVEADDSNDVSKRARSDL